MTTTLASLDEAAKRQRLEEQAFHKVTKARAQLILQDNAKSVFFATLSLKLRLKVCWDIPTAATDGRLLLINPEFIMGMTFAETVGVIAHEVMHPALGHMARRGDRDMSKWNVAADLAINPILIDAGFELPKEGLFPGRDQFADLAPGQSAEAYYSQLKDEHMQPMEGAGDDPGACGGVMDAPGGEAGKDESQAEWEVSVAEAAQVAKSKGDLPGGIDRLVSDLLAPKVDWRQQLREFVSRIARNDYSWSAPNRRYVHKGIYLPSLRSEEVGDICVAIDTSGSISEPELTRFASELQGILESFDVKLTIIYHDSRVAGTQEWSSHEGDLQMTPMGGGGTCHRCVFEHIDEHCIDPTALICFTDLYTSFPDVPPCYPVIWAVVQNEGGIAPFGQTLHVDVD